MHNEDLTSFLVCFVNSQRQLQYLEVICFHFIIIIIDVLKLNCYNRQGPSFIRQNGAMFFCKKESCDCMELNLSWLFDARAQQENAITNAHGYNIFRLDPVPLQVLGHIHNRITFLICSQRCKFVDLVTVAIECSKRGVFRMLLFLWYSEWKIALNPRKLKIPEDNTTYHRRKKYYSFHLNIQSYYVSIIMRVTIETVFAIAPLIIICFIYDSNALISETRFRYLCSLRCSLKQLFNV